MRRRILISNDDGIYSPDIAALAKVAGRLGDVRIVAPDVEQFSMGHAITSSRPLRYRRTPLSGGFDAYRVNGAPAHRVALGIFKWERGLFRREDTAMPAGTPDSITPLRLDLTDEKDLARVLALDQSSAAARKRSRPPATKKNGRRVA